MGRKAVGTFPEEGTTHRKAGCREQKSVMGRAVESFVQLFPHSVIQRLFPECLLHPRQCARHQNPAETTESSPLPSWSLHSNGGRAEDRLEQYTKCQVEINATEERSKGRRAPEDQGGEDCLPSSPPLSPPCSHHRTPAAFADSAPSMLCSLGWRPGGLFPLPEEFSPRLEKGFDALCFEGGMCLWFRMSTGATGVSER